MCNLVKTELLWKDSYSNTICCLKRPRSQTYQVILWLMSERENFPPADGIWKLVYRLKNIYASVNKSMCTNADDKRSGLCWHSVCSESFWMIKVRERRRMLNQKCECSVYECRKKKNRAKFLDFIADFFFFEEKGTRQGTRFLILFLLLIFFRIYLMNPECPLPPNNLISYIINNSINNRKPDARL